MPGRTVLLVEDHADTRETLAMLLTYLGHDVRQACNGREALEHIRSGPRPDLILLDLMMPVMDGSEFRRRQLADPAVADIPVVVISAAADHQAEELPGVADYLRKPVDLQRLAAAVDEYAAPRPALP